MNTISAIVSALFHVIFAALLFLLWIMWEDTIRAVLVGLRVKILGKRKVDVQVGESKEVL